MAMVLKFFQRVSLEGPYPAKYYSEIFDVTEYSSVVGEVKIPMMFAAMTAAVVVETSSQPDFSPDFIWHTLLTTAPTPLVVAGSYPFVAPAAPTLSLPLRFVRVAILLAGAAGSATLCIEGVAREST